jgi:hypothetical protein
MACTGARNAIRKYVLKKKIELTDEYINKSRKDMSEEYIKDLTPILNVYISH